jgi:hypothetical protein
MLLELLPLFFKNNLEVGAGVVAQYRVCEALGSILSTTEGRKQKKT